MEKRESQEAEKTRVRIKLKTDTIKQDPRSVKAEGKSALKKDDTLSPDGSLTSQKRDSQQSSSDTSQKRQYEQNLHTDDERKKNRSKDEAEKLATRKEVVHSIPTSDLIEEKPTDSVEREKNTSSSKLNVQNNEEKASKRQSESSKTEYKGKVETTKDEENSMPKSHAEDLDSMLSPSSKPVTVQQEFLKDPASSQESLSTKAPKETAIMPKEEAVINDSNEQKDESFYEGSYSQVSTIHDSESEIQAEGTSNDPESISPSKPINVQQEFSKDQPSSQESVSNKPPKERATTPKEGEGSISNGSISKISKPLSSIEEEEELVGTSTNDNENERLDETKMASDTGNNHYEPNDDPTRDNTTSEAKNLGEKEIIVSKVSVHNENDATDTPSTKISIKVRKKTNEDLEQSDVDKKSEISEATEQQMIIDNNHDIRNSDITTSSNSNSMMQASTAESADAEEVPTTEKEMPTQGTTNNLAVTQDNSGDKLHENPVEGTPDSVKNDPDKRKDMNDGNGTPLERSPGSEDLKINELKKRVRPGPVFVVKGNPDCYTVKWAANRKVLAYKVGSKNTSRFSTVLIETVEQLERASVRHPSIVSEIMNPPAGAKGSLLSTYFAGEEARRSIKNSLIREAGTNTDHQNGFEAREKSPEYNFFAKDHISPDVEVFGGAVPNLSTTAADPIIQSNNYNYPFLTDYDVNHERKGNK